MVTVDEKQEYNSVWHGDPKRLDDSIKVKAENVVGDGYMPTTGGTITGNLNVQNEVSADALLTRSVDIIPDSGEGVRFTVKFVQDMPVLEILGTASEESVKLEGAYINYSDIAGLTDRINELIDVKLGVIENGDY